MPKFQVESLSLVAYFRATLTSSRREPFDKNQGMGLFPEDSLWLRVYGSASDVRESITNAGMRYSFGIVQLSGNPGEKREHCKVSRKELEA